MEATLHAYAHYVALVIEAIAVTIIAMGALEALVGVLKVGMGGGSKGQERRSVYLSFARWLIAGLTFQLAADVVNTSFSPTWDEIGHLAAIAAIRTFLSFFLDREVADTRELQTRSQERAS